MKAPTTAALFTVVLLLIPAATDAFIPIDPDKEYCRCEYLQDGKSMKSDELKNKLKDLEQEITLPAEADRTKADKEALKLIEHLKYFMDQCDNKKQCRRSVYHEKDDPVVRSRKQNQTLKHGCVEVTVTENMGSAPADQFFTCMTRVLAQGHPLPTSTTVAKLEFTTKEAANVKIKGQKQKTCDCKVEVNGEQITEEDLNKRRDELEKIIGDLKTSAGANLTWDEEPEFTAADSILYWYKQCDKDKCKLENVQRSKDLIMRIHDEAIENRSRNDEDFVNECVVARYQTPGPDGYIQVKDFHTCSVMLSLNSIAQEGFNAHGLEIYSEGHLPPAVPTTELPQTAAATTTTTECVEDTTTKGSSATVANMVVVGLAMAVFMIQWPQWIENGNRE